jgi:phage shock protein A
MAFSENDNIAEELLKSIQATTSLIQGFMNDMKSNATALATLEAKLESLSENARTLSKIVRDDNGNKSVLTRIALVENDLSDLYTNYKEFKLHVYKKLEETKDQTIKHIDGVSKKIEEINNKHDEKEKSSNKKLMAILQIAPGAIALVLVVIKIVWGIDIGL